MAKNEPVLTFRERLTVLNEEAHAVLRLALKKDPTSPVIADLKSLVQASDLCVDNA